MGEAERHDHPEGLPDFAKGNVPAVFAVFDAAITWYVPGHGPLSGDYTGHAQVGGFFQRTMELSRGAFGIDVHNVLADGDVVVALVTVKAQRNGVAAAVRPWRSRRAAARRQSPHSLRAARAARPPRGANLAPRRAARQGSHLRQCCRKAG
jgi:uncharacterized protein